MPNRKPLFAEAEVHIVSGKGGTGKSTLAAALALSLASTGKTVLLCEVEGRQGIAQLFDVPPLPYAERLIARGSNHGEVYALAIDPESALLEYLNMYYRLGIAGKALDKFGVIDFATTVAPGVRDVLLTGKVYEAVNRNSRNKGARNYDAVILDAPPTGRITQFLNVNDELAGLAKVGPIKNQADAITELLRSERTRVHLVSILEEMPVQETIDGVAELTKAQLPVGAILLNLLRPQVISSSDRGSLLKGEITASKINPVLKKVGLADPELAAALIIEGKHHAERRKLEEQQLKLVKKIGVPLVEVPLLADGIDLAGLYELADTLKAQGL